MPSKAAQKITFISFGKVKLYKVWLLILIILMTAFGAFVIFRTFHRSSFPLDLINLWLPGLIIYRLWKLYLGVKAVEFDQEFLYVTQPDYEIIVPLENIKKVEIKSLTGVYKIELYDMIQSGNEIFFMPSLIYPLDYSKQDDKVNLLRSYAWKARQNMQPIPKNALTS
ncbi:MAG: hypothetical protein HOP08_00460 [Cyclobacteriaceae bacterium]|nr:hypothetical protein [Cyclobacteriaceae bacterium]